MCCALFIYAGCVCVHCHLNVCIFCCVCLLDVKESTMRESVSLLAGLCARQYNWAFVCTCVCVCVCVSAGAQNVYCCVFVFAYGLSVYTNHAHRQTCRCMHILQRTSTYSVLTFLFCAYLSTCMQKFVDFKELEGTCQCCDVTSMIVGVCMHAHPCVSFCFGCQLLLYCCTAFILFSYLAS